MSEIQLGPVSEGTLEPEELLNKFADVMDDVTEGDIEERERIARLCGEAKALVRIYKILPAPAPDAITEYSNDVLEDIRQELSENSPEGIYFGTAPGDGACFGFFVDWDYLEHEIHDGRIIKNPDERDDHKDKLVLDVNDHGNATLLMWAEPRQQWVEIWSVV